jgi:hypothetical protein
MKETQQYDRFNLETEIQNVWQTGDDLDVIIERFFDAPDGPMTDDEIGNLLLGLSELHDTRCRKLFLVFGRMIEENCFNDRETIKNSSGDHK